MEKHNTLIIGAGPAGLRCAKVLAGLEGGDFLLLEKKPKFDRKVCTGLWGLTEKTKIMGVPNKLIEKKFKKVLFSLPHKKVEIKLEKPFVGTLNRKELSNWMFKEAKKEGANIVFDSPVTKIGKNYVVVKKKKIFFNNLVGADGSLSVVRKSLNLPKSHGVAMQYWTKQKFKNLEIHYDADRFGPWYSWIMPHKKITSIGTGVDPRLLCVKKAKDNLDSWCSENDFDVSLNNFEAVPINYEYKGFRFGNKFLIGDAAGFASGLSGEGIYFGMASGEDVARMIIDNKHKPNLINFILNIKRKHEIVLKAFELNKTLEKVEYNILIKLLKLKFFDKKVVELAA